MTIGNADIERIVRAVVQSMGDVPRSTSPVAPAATQASVAAGPAAAKEAALPMGIFHALDDAVAAADTAYRQMRSVAMRSLVVAAIRQAGEQHAQVLAEMAVAETGMGRVQDKFIKNVSQARQTPGVECLAPTVVSGDHGLTLMENGAWGVVAAVTPSTNPAASIINNAISMVAAGNTVVFAPHPAAKAVSQRTVTLINEAIVAAGGPVNVITTMAKPSIAAAQQLFSYPGIHLLTVTGGEAVVEEARRHTDKRLIAAGAGNPPVVVDETANLEKAARDIVWGASFDNNIICVDEKEVVVVASVADRLKDEMKKHRAVEISLAQADQLVEIVLGKIGLDRKGTVARDWVGRDASKIAAKIGLMVPADTRLLFFDAPANHPFAVTEQMMPILPVIRAADVDEAIALAVKLEGGCKHTAAMHSRNLDNLDRMANAINTSIFVKNGPCLAGLGFGGEGWTSMTISTPTGEGVTSARTFVRLRRCVLVDNFRIV